MALCNLLVMIIYVANKKCNDIAATIWNRETIIENP